MEIKEFKIRGKKHEFLRYKDKWVYPVFETYEGGLGSPVAMSLWYIDKGEVDLYADVTVNLPQCERDAGCQFIDTNNNGKDIIDWLEQNKFGERTGNVGKSGFCTYPEFDFYKGENFWKYKKFSDEAMDEQKSNQSLMHRQRTFHGNDLNKATSLFELGLLVRYVSSEKSWQCVYKSGTNRYSYGWISEVALHEILTKDWGKKHLEAFMKNCCSYLDEWVSLPMQRKISDFIDYFGSMELFGEDYSGGYTAKDICKKLHIKYDTDYEQA